MPKTSSGPKNWPTSIPYLSTPVISRELSKTILSTEALNSPSLEADVVTISNPQTPYANVCITPINEPNHPAYQQCGLFSTRLHPPDSFICLYLGFVHASVATKSGSNPKSDYDLSMDRELGLAIDAAEIGNEARFINDYRGVADRPNAEFRDVIVRLQGGKKERGVGIFVKAIKKDRRKGKMKDEVIGIRKGEEILVSYGRGFWSSRKMEQEYGDGEGEEVVS